MLIREALAAAAGGERLDAVELYDAALERRSALAGDG